MTLYEYLCQTRDWETTVWDKDYDVETYFYKTDDKDKWDKSMNKLAKLLTVLDFGKNGVTVNLSEVIEKKISKLKETDLFIKCDINNIMSCLDSILAGNVSEEWFEKFVCVLKE